MVFSIRNYISGTVTKGGQGPQAPAPPFDFSWQYSRQEALPSRIAYLNGYYYSFWNFSCRHKEKTVLLCVYPALSPDLIRIFT